MIIVEATEFLQILTDATATTTEPCWQLGGVWAANSTFLNAASEAGATTGVTAVNMVTGVTSNQFRVMGLSVYNLDTTVRNITIRRSSTLLIIKINIVPGGSLHYNTGTGWTVNNAEGVPQVVYSQNNLTGDVTSVGTVTTLTNAPVIAKVLTSYASGAGTVSAADSILSAIQKLNGNNETNANLTGPVTSTGNATAIANGAILNAMLANGAVANLSGTNTGDQINITGNAATVTTNANLTGQVTSVGNATTIATAQPDVHTWALTQTFTVAPVFTDQSGSRTALGLGTLATQNGTFSGTSSGTNTGDQTSIVGIAGTKAQFDTAITDGDILYVGDSATSAATVASANESTDTTCFLLFITASGTQTLATKNNTGLTYNSATNTLGATTFVGALTGTSTNCSGNSATVTTNANLTGHVTSTGNATLLGSFTKAQLDIAISDGNVLYVGDVTSNATHTGDATGSGALIVVAINGTSLAGLTTGILKNTTGTGIPSIAVAGTDYLTPSGSAANLNSFPTLNQNTTGSAATLTTSREIGGTSFNGSANITPLNTTVANEATDTTCFPTFVTAATGNLPQLTNAAFTFNSSTVSLACTTFVGAFTGTASGNLVSGGALGTPSSGIATNLTGTASGLTAGNVTTNANLTGHITSTGNATLLGSFTKAQLDTAVSDGNVVYVGDNITGSAATLTTARTINGTSFNGSANIEITGSTLGASIVAASAAINTTETLLVKSSAMAANRFVAGSVLRITAWGTCTSTAANVSTFRVRIGVNGTTADGVVQAAATAVSANAGTAIPFKITWDIVIRTVSATATTHGSMTLLNLGTTGIAAQTTQLVIPTFSTFDSTASNMIVDLTYQSAATTTTCTFQGANIEFVSK